MLNWELEPFSCNNNFLVAAIEGKSWQWNFAVVIVLILPSLRKCSFEQIISPYWILVDILSISQHVASNLWLAWPRYWLSQGAGARVTANATTAKPKLNNHGVKIQFWSLGDYDCLVLVPCKLLLRLPLQFQPLHLNNCCNEALMNEFDSSWQQTTTKILWLLRNTFLVTFILYPMIIPRSISVIGLDMMWDPDTDSQSLSMSGFSYMLQQKLYQDGVFLAPSILSCMTWFAMRSAPNEAQKMIKEK